MTKSFVKLAWEFQSRFYNALVAHTMVVFIRYIMLIFAIQINPDRRTFDELFNLYTSWLREKVIVMNCES